MYDMIIQSDIFRVRRALSLEGDASNRASLEAELRSLEMRLLTANDPALGRLRAH